VMACDICGCNKAELSELRGDLSTDEIKQVCPSCSAKITAQMRKLRYSFVDKLVVAWIKNLRQSFLR
jgi:hypothetical protein